MVLKKNQALDNGIRLEGGNVAKINSQMFNDPLHDAKVVHHLHKSNEEDDGTQDAGEEPALVDNGVLIEEKDGADLGLLQEVQGEESQPPEDFEAGISLEDKESDGLLEKETDDDRLPMNDFNSCRASPYRNGITVGGGKGPTMGLEIVCGKLTRNKIGI